MAGQAQGPEKGLVELERLPDPSRLKDYPFFPAAQGEFHRLAGHGQEARACFAKALRLARNVAEARFLERKLKGCMASDP
jgi:RNA polymerase sigma-70 factor (ECF subfamily)